MAQNQQAAESALEIDRLATQLAKDPHSKVFMPLAEEYGKVGMWQEAAAVLEDGLQLYPGFITAMVALGRAYDHMGQATKARAILEESVKLSPENLRAHRTLIKIYTSQGQNESALQSCAVILTVNPRDEEALSIQSALGGQLKQKQELPRSKAHALATSHAEQAAISPIVAKSADSAQATHAGTDLSASMTDETKITAIRAQNQIVEQLMESVPAADADTGVIPAPPHADVVAQLESWLRSIESRRHDRGTTNEPPPKTS
jgi:tetratricopeptide (TPR) repeat protein